MPRQKNELRLTREGICVQLGKGLEEDKPSRQNSLLVSKMKYEKIRGNSV